MRREGFTILEMLIVVALIGLLTVAFVSRIGGGSSARLDAGTKTVRSTLRYAAEQAIATGRTHRWICDLDEQQFRIEEEVSVNEEEDEPDRLASTAELLDLEPPIPETEFRPVSRLPGQWTVLEEGEVDSLDVLIESVLIGDEESDEGTISVAFAGDGGADPAEIWLSNRDGFSNGLRVVPFTGEVRRIAEDEL